MLSGVSHVHAPGTLTCNQVFCFVFFFEGEKEREGGMRCREGGV